MSDLITIPIKILCVEDHSFPVWLRFEITDYHGARHEFVEKAPVILDGPVPENFPHWIYLRAQRVSQNNEYVTLRTDKPFGVAALNGQTVFNIDKDELTTLE